MARDDRLFRLGSVALENAKDFLEAVPLPAVLISVDEKIEALNVPAAGLFGDMVLAGRHYMTVMRQPGLVDTVERAFRTQQATRTRYQRSAGERMEQFRVLASPVTGPRGACVLVTFEDVTDMHLAEEMRRDFVANVSHELKTPLTALIGFIETLKGAARHDPAAQDRFLDIMAGEADRMNRLIADLLSLSRVESDERVRPTDHVALSSLVMTSLRTLGHLAENNGVQFEPIGIDNSEELAKASAVMGDEDQLQQIFLNLIEYAIKYGGAGGKVTVAMSIHGTSPGFKNGYVQVDVIDQGDGFDPIHIPRLTERFYRVDNHRSRGLGGTGLGLAIVKHILNRHRGRLRIDSALGEGARFSVLLPKVV